ncbi:SDR family NAD(P)-dependent oxidoreductase [Chitinophaga silvisoli]|uniref:SDR family NAD(P)-dependent oxidoreductase n=1 Tax=Chitinophaga silvisoli TaxID=2291814 RepID=A0A3E1NUS1_9BACT|nr:SDR family NAD(P)-dependent oxidoreductase [Chitinophaga silvisoli]
MKGTAAGKTIFISGASRGIGQATAIAFAQAGAAAIYLTARSEEGLLDTKAQILKANPDTQCAYSLCDVTDATQVKAAIDHCVTTFGSIDVADVNAGYLDKWTKIGESDISSWWYTWEVNMKGAYHVVRYVIPHLIQSAQKDANSGHLVLLSSIGAQLVTPGASDYQTSKHAINRLCEFIQVDHGEEGIKCFAIHPGGVPTDLAKHMPQEIHPHLVDEPELSAGFIVWLCSGQADWATGRYLDSTWDVNDLLQMKDRVIGDDLFVNRLRT